MRLLLLITTSLIFWYPVMAQPKTDALLQKMLSESRSEPVKMVMKQPDTFRLQIIYTQINRDKNNRIVIQTRCVSSFRMAK